MTAVTAGEMAHHLRYEIDEVLHRMGCQYFACDGPNKPFVDMGTCWVCARIQELRQLIARLS